MAIMMPQAVMTQPGQIEFREVPIPAIGYDEVLIQVKRIGVCGSDIHVWHGLHPYTSYPVVQGHEVSGLVARVGRNVKKEFSIGDKVVFMPQVTCGVCYPCRNGMEHICDNLKVMGFQTSGAAQEYFPVQASKVLKLPNIITLDQAALIEPISVGVHAIRRVGGVEGKRVVVLGAGNIGNLLAQVAMASGARTLLITDISEYKLDKARQSGLTHAVNSHKVNMGEAISTVLGPDKADVIFECVGHQETISDAINYARKGSTIVVVGVFGARPEVDLGLVQDREITILGTLMYQKPDYERAIELVADGKLNLAGIITHRYPFRKYKEAYLAIDNLDGENMKVMIEL
jgi:L-iditol 2-dehydrogenase